MLTTSATSVISLALALYTTPSAAVTISSVIKTIPEGVWGFSAISLATAVYTASLIGAATAIPIETIPKGLWGYSPDGRRVDITPSKVNATIFGVDAEDFDYSLGGTEQDYAQAIEAVETFARVWKTGDADAILVAFLNQTLNGSMDPRKPFDRQFLCQDLSCPMNKGTTACDGIDVLCWGEMREL